MRVPILITAFFLVLVRNDTINYNYNFYGDTKENAHLLGLDGATKKLCYLNCIFNTMMNFDVKKTVEQFLNSSASQLSCSDKCNPTLPVVNKSQEAK